MGLDNTTQIQITFAGKTINVWDEGTSEQFSIINGDQSKAIRRMRCAWSDRITLLAALLGGASAVGGGSTFVLGHPYPYMAGQNGVPGLVATDIKITGEGLLSNTIGTTNGNTVGNTNGSTSNNGTANSNPTGTGDNIIAYERAFIELYYRPWIYNQNGIATQRMSTSSNVLAIDTAQPMFKWGNGDPIPPTQTPAITFTTTQITIDQRIGVFDPAAYANLTNCRNSSAVRLQAGQTAFAANTLIYWGVTESVRNISVLGAEMWTVSHAFEFNKYGWAKLFRPGAGHNDFESFTFNDGSDLYPAINFVASFPNIWN